MSAYILPFAVMSRLRRGNQALSELFVYKQVLKQDLPWLGEVVHARKPVRIPVVLSMEEGATNSVLCLRPNKFALQSWVFQIKASANFDEANNPIGRWLLN